MEVLKIIVGVCLIFIAALFSIGMIRDIIELIKLSKLKKKWAAEQERAKISHDIKLGCCKKCLYRMNGINYFGYPCIYNSEWLCEGPAAPKELITIEAKRAQDWARITRCKDCQYWENNHCNSLKINIANPDWFCATGTRRE